MRRNIRSLVVVCLLGFAVSAFAAPRDAASGMRKFVKRVVRALGDGLTIPGSSPAPNPPPNP